LISLESLRSDHLGCYGYSKNTSPNIDKLAQEGTLFLNTVSATSWTLPSITSLLTSVYQGVHQVSNDGKKLDEMRTTLAEVMKDNGYATAAFVSGPYTSSAFGLNQGFDVYKNCSFIKGNYKKKKHFPSKRDFSESHKDVINRKTSLMASDWLNRHYKESFFLYLHYWDIHYDYIPPAPYNKIFDSHYKGNISAKKFQSNTAINKNMNSRDLRHIIALYDGEIRWTDYNIGFLLDKLKDLKQLQNTLIVLTADHGEEFFEHGGKGHRRTLYDEVIKVPLIFKFPRRIPKGKRIKTQVRTIDIMPTILDIMNIPDHKETMGKSLWKLIHSKKKAEMNDRTALSELHNELKSLRTNGWKIIYNISSKKLHFIDLKRDPLEKSNNLYSDPRLTRKAKDKLLLIMRKNMKICTSLPKKNPHETPKLDPEAISLLKTLGYIK
jgi:arylsulfatase A-like enzyme